MKRVRQGRKAAKTKLPKGTPVGVPTPPPPHSRKEVYPGMEEIKSVIKEEVFLVMEACL